MDQFCIRMPQGELPGRPFAQQLPCKGLSCALQLEIHDKTDVIHYSCGNLSAPSVMPSLALSRTLL
eukprot:6475229-Amphidinium_carterae.1